MNEHAQPEFFAKYGFCSVDCVKCNQIDAADTRPHEEKVADGMAKAVAAMKGEGLL